MEFNKRVKDASQVFDSQWKVNNNYKERQEFLNQRQEHFNKMYNIKDKQDMRKEILNANSVNGRVESLNQNMRAASEGQRLNRMNNFKNNFR